MSEVRILYALNVYRPYIDGVGISIERQAIGLAARGHEVAIVAPGLRFADTQERWGQIKVFRLRAVKVIADQWRLPVVPERGVVRAFQAFDPDVVVVSVPFFLSRSAWQAARACGRPLVGITSMMPEWLYYNVGLLKPLAGVLNSGLWRIITDYYNQCDCVVGVTETALRFLEAHGLRRPSRVISNGVPLDRFCARPRDEALAARLGVPRKPTVIYAGRLDAEKCVDACVRAIPSVVREVDAHFVVGGEGTQRLALEELARELGVADRVTFPGFLPAEEYERLYSLGDVFAIASPCELQSIVTLEAAASGLPIVAANAGALPELVRPGGNGYLFPPGDSLAMAEAIVRILRDRELARNMAEASRQIAQAHDINETYRHYEELYQEMTARRRVA